MSTLLAAAVSTLVFCAPGYPGGAGDAQPFVDGWHRRDVEPWLAAHGFELVDDEPGMPIRFLSARRVG